MQQQKHYERQVNSAYDLGYLSATGQLRYYIDNQREPLLSKILAGETISQEESERLTVYSELVEELEKMKGDI